MMQVVVCNK